MSLGAIQRFPESFPDFPGSSLDFTKCQPLLGSQTTTDDLQILPLKRPGKFCLSPPVGDGSALSLFLRKSSGCLFGLSILAYEWYLECMRTYSTKYNDWKTNTKQEWKACTKVGLIHHVLVAIHESVLVLKHTFDEHRQAFPDVPKRRFGSPSIRPCYYTQYGHLSLIDVSSSFQQVSMYHRSSEAHGLLRVLHFAIIRQSSLH